MLYIKNIQTIKNTQTIKIYKILYIIYIKCYI